MKFKVSRKARINRTKLYFQDRDLFLAKLDVEIKELKREAEKQNKKALIRLNGTSDIIWERIDRSIFDSHKSIQFYDYTKVPNRDLSTIDNYSLTYSLQGIYDPTTESRI